MNETRHAPQPTSGISRGRKGLTSLPVRARPCQARPEAHTPSATRAQAGPAPRRAGARKRAARARAFQPRNQAVTSSKSGACASQCRSTACHLGQKCCSSRPASCAGASTGAHAATQRQAARSCARGSIASASRSAHASFGRMERCTSASHSLAPNTWRAARRASVAPAAQRPPSGAAAPGLPCGSIVGRPSGGPPRISLQRGDVQGWVGSGKVCKSQSWGCWGAAAPAQAAPRPQGGPARPRGRRLGRAVCQGDSSASADASLGCHCCSAAARRKRMPGYRSSSCAPSSGSQGCSHACSGTVSLRGSQACTARLSCARPAPPRQPRPLLPHRPSARAHVGPRECSTCGDGRGPAPASCASVSA